MTTRQADRPIQFIQLLLKEPNAWFAQIKDEDTWTSLPTLLLITVLCNLAYSMIIGSYCGNAQWYAAPVKIILGSALATLLCYPSLYIFGCLSGADINPGKTLALLVSGMCLTGILLIGFAPVAFVFTFAIQSQFFMGIVHFLAWGISIYFGIRHISLGLGEMSCHNTALIKIWGVILVVTMLQMTVTLRPIIGQSDHLLTSEKRFFIEHWLDNIPKNRL